MRDTVAASAQSAALPVAAAIIERRIILVMLLLVHGSLAVWADYDSGKRAFEEKRYNDALDEWRSAAHYGDARAMVELGALYVIGLVVPQDFVLAHMWFNLAASRGDTGAAEQRDSLAEKMVPAERADAQKLAREWRPAATTLDDEVKSSEASSATKPPPARVHEAQSLLEVLGYEPGPATGEWSERTARAYHAFLRDAGLTFTAVLTPQALQTMRTVARSKGSSLPEAPANREPQPHAVPAAARAGDLVRLKAAIAGGADVNIRDQTGWTALMHAADNGYSLLVPPLLESGAEPDLRAATGATALFMASVHGHIDIVSQLLAVGANPQVPGPKSMTVAAIARLKYGDPDADDLLDYDYGVWSLLNGIPPAHNVAALNHDPEVLAMWLDSGIAIDETTGDGWTMLHTASYNNPNADVAALLIDRGADVHARDKLGRTPLLVAAYRNASEEVIERLIELGSDVNAPSTDGDTPILIAIGYGGSTQTIAALIDGGASFREPFGRLDYTMLHFAAQLSDDPAVIDVLIDHGARVDARDKGGETPLMKVGLRKTSEFTVDMAAALMERGANVNARNSRGGTVLHGAAQNSDRPELIAALIARGARVDALDEVGETPLMDAIIYNKHNKNFEMATALINGGADLKAGTAYQYGYTPLHVAAHSGSDSAMLSMLIDRGADVDTRDNAGETPLMKAVAYNRNSEYVLDIMSALIDRGADVNARNDIRLSVLHAAAQMNQDPRVTTMLIDRGARVNERDRFGDTPLAKAVAFNPNPSVAAAIRRRGGR